MMLKLYDDTQDSWVVTGPFPRIVHGTAYGRPEEVNEKLRAAGGGAPWDFIGVTGDLLDALFPMTEPGESHIHRKLGIGWVKVMWHNPTDPTPIEDDRSDVLIIHRGGGYVMGDDGGTVDRIMDAPGFLSDEAE